MKYDINLNIATGYSCGAKVWRNKKTKWSDLVVKLVTPKHTSETLKEFTNLSKTDQLSIKDVGGYVGGYLSNGRRSPQNVVNRQLITLDIDDAHLNFWDDFLMCYDCAALCHGTHKHSDATPRYRLIIPLDREVAPDEYVAISRQVAGMLGIEMFDNTTFETNRLMFWPSTPKDQTYYSVYQDGPFLNADEVLDTYLDWRDSSLWPTSKATFENVDSSVKKQEDPTTKNGIVGAFCRAYSITEVIDELLTDEYVEAMNGRYTYLKGSAAAGLVIYGDKFAYSHHGTDPTGGQLCNAFDLFRVHKFGHLDEGATGKKKPSFKAMEDFIKKDPRTKGTIAKETIQGAKYAFSEPTDEEIDLEWAKGLEVDGRGQYLSTASNLNLIFENDPVLKKVFKYNHFDNKQYVFRSLPWRKISKPDTLRDVDLAGIRNYLESTYKISSVQKVKDALTLTFEQHSYHPIKEYFESLAWDGQKRIENILPDFFGVVNNTYTIEAIKKTLVGAVARILDPGCKFDLVLTLVGKQGDGKSTFVRILGKDWSSDSFNTVHGREAFEQLQGAWLMEVAELAGLRKSDIESVKHYFSKQDDTLRVAFGETVQTYLRQNIFIATTNKDDFLQDSTGNRRFLPIDTDRSKACKNIFTELAPIVDQIWAEALGLYNNGETLYLSKEAEIIARREQSNHSQTDERRGVIEGFLEMGLPDDWNQRDVDARFLYYQNPNGGMIQRDTVCVAQIWCECLGKPKEDMSRYNTREINDIMRSLDGWEAQKSPKNFKLYGKQKYYKRVES